MTVLEARVALEKSEELQAGFARGRERLPSQMVQMFLVRDRDNATLWRAVAVWKSTEALAEYRRSVETPGGVVMFRSVGAEPTLRIFDIVLQGGAK